MLSKLEERKLLDNVFRLDYYVKWHVLIEIKNLNKQVF